LTNITRCAILALMTDMGSKLTPS